MSLVLDTGASISSSVAGVTASADTGLFAVAADTNGAVKAGATDISGGNNVAAQTLTIVGSGSDTVELVNDATARNIAAAVTAAAGTTGVTATATTSATISNLSANGTVSFNLYGSNNAAVLVSATVTTGDLNSLVSAINDKTGSTGITAEISGSGNAIALTSATGDNISIENFEHSAAVTDTAGGNTEVQQSIRVTGGTGDAVTLVDGGTTAEASQTDSTVVGGTVTFQSTSGTFNIQSSVAASAGGIFTGAATTAQASALSSVAQIDISSVTGAQDAITVIDGALAQVDSIRADLGAIQNRFQSTISNLSTTSENISAARSRIRDADFASETAELTRTQILQQAGVAMVAQANQLPQTVLSLLG